MPYGSGKFDYAERGVCGFGSGRTGAENFIRVREIAGRAGFATRVSQAAERDTARGREAKRLKSCFYIIYIIFIYILSNDIWMKQEEEILWECMLWIIRWWRIK